MRLIDADAILAEHCADCTEETRELCKYDALCGSMMWIADAPTVDAVPVVHGRWVQIGYDKAMDRITCSCCKGRWNILDNDTESFNYCPNCGAKMDQGVE